MATKFTFLDVSIEKQVATLVLNRPEKMNSLNMKLRDEIEHCFDIIENDANICSMVLTGGTETFCPGFDIAEVIDTNLESFSHRIMEYHVQLYTIAKPVVAAVSGFALAGGFDLALCGDIIIASETAIFGHPEIRFGVNPLLSPLWRKVGPGKAAEIAMTGETINAHDAHRMGLVMKVVSADTLIDEAFEIARKLAKIDPRTLAAVKRAGMVAPGLDIRAGLEYEFGLTAEIFRRSDPKPVIENYARKIGLIE